MVANKSDVNLRKDLQSRYVKDRLIRPTIVLTFLTFDEICSANVSSESMMIPRSFSSETCPNSWFQILYRSVLNIIELTES